MIVQLAKLRCQNRLYCDVKRLNSPEEFKVDILLFAFVAARNFGDGGIQLYSHVRSLFEKVIEDCIHAIVPFVFAVLGWVCSFCELKQTLTRKKKTFWPCKAWKLCD